MTSRRRKMATGLQLETLEGRLVLSTAAHPLHAAVATHAPQAHVAQAHVTAPKAPAIPNPVLVNLTPGTTGITITDVSYDARVHLITVKGTITVPPQTPPLYYYYGYPTPYPTTDYIGVVATQAVNRLQSVSGYQYSNKIIADATVTKIPFSGNILATAGEFKSGIVTISVTSSIAYDYNYSTYSVIAHMRNAKAY
jgi:hypothetical protein